MTPVACTFFPDKLAQCMGPESFSAALFGNPPTAKTKAELPYFKLATFSGVETEKGCCRHDAGVVAVTGCELDYDRGTTTMQAAAAKFKGAGVYAILYETPSSTLEAPRWRVMLPFAQGFKGTPDQMRMYRSAAVRAAEGILGETVAKESHTLSQAFYFGVVDGKQWNWVETPGQCIDVVKDIKSFIKEVKPSGRQANDPDRLDTGEAFHNILTGAEFHTSLTRLAAHYVKRGTKRAVVVDLLTGLMNNSQDAGSERWLDRMQEIPRAVDSAISKYGPDKPPALETNPSSVIAAAAFAVATYEPAADPCSDVKNAHRFWELAGDSLQFVTGIGWFKWNDVCWEQDPHEPLRIGQRIGFQVAAEVKIKWGVWQSEESKDKRDGIDHEINKLTRHIKHSESKNAIDAAIRLAESIKPVPAAMLDTNPWLMNCANGTLDLKNGELRAPDKKDYLTKSTPIEYDQDARCPGWEKTLMEIFNGNKNIIKFLQRVFGYCLTGFTGEQVFIIFRGDGANGKDVILGRIRKLMGQYAGEVAPGLLIQSRNEQHPTGIYDLRGKRLGISSETGEGKPLDETLIKQLTGGDKLKARGMRQDFIEFTNETKLILMTNHLPEIKGADYAIWRRIHVVPFDRIFKEEERDNHLGERLDKTELPGILAWAVRGCTEWQRDGLAPPVEVQQATAGYKDDQDILKEFFESECVFGPTNHATATDIWNRWQLWCRGNNQRPHSQKWLSPRLELKGCTKEHSRSGTVYGGIALKPPGWG